MERSTDKHNPRMDDALKDETSSLRRGAPVEPRAEEWREMEGPGDDQPSAGEMSNSAEFGWQGQDLSRGEVIRRSEIARHLEPGTFPAGRDGVLEAARRQNAPDDVLVALSALPGGVTFENVQQVWDALGGEDERRV